jgi:hypothetical protein
MEDGAEHLGSDLVVQKQLDSGLVTADYRRSSQEDEHEQHEAIQQDLLEVMAQVLDMNVLPDDVFWNAEQLDAEFRIPCDRSLLVVDVELEFFELQRLSFLNSLSSVQCSASIEHIGEPFVHALLIDSN